MDHPAQPDRRSLRGRNEVRRRRVQLKDVVGTTTLNLTVKRASWIDGVWRATAVSGTYVQSAPRVEAGMFYCPAGSATYSFTGTLSQEL